MKNLADLMDSVPLEEQFRRIAAGLRAPRCSCERQYVLNALAQMIGPSTVSFLGAGIITMMTLLIQPAPQKEPGRILFGPVFIDPPRIEQEEPWKQNRDQDKNDPAPKDPMRDMDNFGVGPGDKAYDAQDIVSDASGPVGIINDPAVADLNTAAITDTTAIMAQSSVIMRNISGRTEDERQKAIMTYGGPVGGPGGGGGSTEGAVTNALRWLKREQLPDGSWKNTKPAMTGLALLTYLAHGETSSSSEFGVTVEKALRWLLDNQEADGHFKGRDAHDYSHPIAAYALCEAYTMRRLPVLRTAAEKAVDIIVKGQHASGGWDYNCKQSDRDDTSYMGWCVQALKAARIAELDCEGLDGALRKAADGFKRNCDATGRFGYTSNKDGTGGLTGIGVLCMQLLGRSRELEARNGIIWLEKNATFNWDKPWLSSPIYYWYYVTQAKFHTGGNIWNEWNRQFAVQLVRNQKIEKKAIPGPGGRMCDVGWWDPPAGVNGHSDGVVMDTTLCTLQLEVYYRYLPTFQAPNQLDDKPEEKSGDLNVMVSSAVNQQHYSLLH